MTYPPGMTGIVWWEVETPDPTAFQAFTGELFGWTFEPAFGDTELGADYWIIRTLGDDAHEAEGIGGLQRAEPRPPDDERTSAAGTRVYALVEDLEDALAHAASIGGTVLRRRTALGGDDHWFGIVRDPSGVSLGLWTANPPTG